MKKILILNFTRLGDLIQTSPLLAGLKDKYPGCHITLAANVSFMGICKNMPNIDRLVVFDPKQFIHADGGQTSILDMYRYLDNFTAGLKAEKFDMMVNLSHSDLTAIMGRMLDIPEVRGIYSNMEGEKVITDPWLMYFSGILSFRRYNTFNLVDMYQLGGGVVPNGRGLLLDTETPSAEGMKLLAELGIGGGEKLIAVQAGSSLKERRWPPEKFARAADLISARWKGRTLLLGARGERELAEQVAAAMTSPVANLAGKTSLEQLIGVVKRAALLITNDTATMHIAAAVGTPLVALFLVHAYAAETGPYCSKAVMLEPEISCFPCLHSSVCSHYACLDYVTPEAVAAAAESAVSGVPSAKMSVAAEQFPKMRVWAPFFDERGIWDMRPLKRGRANEEEILARMYRLYFSRTFAEGLGTQYWKEYLERNYEPWPGPEKREWVARETAVFSGLRASADKGAGLAAKARAELKKGETKKAKTRLQEFFDIDKAVETAGLTHPECMPLVRMFTIGRANIPAGGPDIVLAETQTLYKGVSGACEFMIQQLAAF